MSELRSKKEVGGVIDVGGREQLPRRVVAFSKSCAAFNVYSEARLKEQKEEQKQAMYKNTCLLQHINVIILTMLQRAKLYCSGQWRGKLAVAFL